MKARMKANRSSVRMRSSKMKGYGGIEREVCADTATSLIGRGISAGLLLCPVNEVRVLD